MTQQQTTGSDYSKLSPPMEAKEAAAFLKCAVRTLRYYYKECGLPVHYRSPRKVLFYREQLEAWIVARNQQHVANQHITDRAAA